MTAEEKLFKAIDKRFSIRSQFDYPIANATTQDMCEYAERLEDALAKKADEIHAAEQAAVEATGFGPLLGEAAETMELARIAFAEVLERDVDVGDYDRFCEQTLPKVHDSLLKCGQKIIAALFPGVDIPEEPTDGS
jgi:hypothetical protein